MLDVPNKADLSQAQKIAIRILRKSKDQDARPLARAFLDLVEGLDTYVDALYPSFALIEAEMRENGCQIVLTEGRFVLADRNGKFITTGPTLKNLFINYLLWNTDWEEQEALEDQAKSEDFYYGEEV